MRSLPAKKSQKYLCRMARKQNLTMGKGAVVSCLSKYIHPSLWVRNHHVNIAKDHRLERMTFRQRELKEIRGKDRWPLWSLLRDCRWCWYNWAVCPIKSLLDHFRWWSRHLLLWWRRLFTWGGSRRWSDAFRASQTCKVYYWLVQFLTLTTLHPR